MTALSVRNEMFALLQEKRIYSEEMEMWGVQI
jgi:hypothetical protein